MSAPTAPEPHPGSPVPVPIAEFLGGEDAPVLAEIERQAGQVAELLRASGRRGGSIMPVTPHHPEQATR